MAKTLSDPNVRDAMREIRTILKKRNLAGHIVVASPTHTEHALMYDLPKWSAVSIEKNRMGEMQVKVMERTNKDIELAKLSVTMQVLERIQKILAKGNLSLDYVLYNLKFNKTVVDFSKYKKSMLSR